MRSLVRTPGLFGRLPDKHTLRRRFGTGGAGWGDSYGIPLPAQYLLVSFR